MDSLDGIVRSALKTFAEEALDGSWNGQREREAVSLFAFGTLLTQVSPGEVLSSPSQVGLEVPIPQVTVGNEDSTNKKDQVCKDLVIWPAPRMTCWDEDHNPTVPPAAVIEWKFDRASIYDGDVNWLAAFTRRYPECTGYAVTANQPMSRFTLTCTRVSADQTQQKWLHIA